MANPSTLDRLRTGMKFSLWSWGAYWAGGGLMMLYGGLDPISLGVLLGAAVTMGLLLYTGALSATVSRSYREFLIERPLYLLAAVVVLALLATLLPATINVGLLLFAAVHLGALALVAVRLADHVRGKGGLMKTRADQLVILLALSGSAAFLVFLDALLPLFGDIQAGGSSMFVATVNWLSLVYPPLLLLAARPFREPLRTPRRARAPRRGGTKDTVKA